MEIAGSGPNELHESGWVMVWRRRAAFIKLGEVAELKSVRLRIVHETNPPKYFPALFGLDREGRITITGAHRYSVFKEWLRAGLKDRKPFGARGRDALSDLWFRLRAPFISGEVIVLGFAPWDWRILFMLPLFARNRIIYHTSWPDWDTGRTPRQYGPLTPTFKAIWLWALRHPNVRIVAVLDVTRVELMSRFKLQATVIPHAVPSAFFDAGRANTGRVAASRTPGPLRLIHVGELSRKKGVERLLDLVQSLPPGVVELTFVGDGPMREACLIAAAENSEIRVLGQVRDRTALADEMAAHDILVLLSQRDGSWQELFGIVITEALAAGLGVIATRHIGPMSIFSGKNMANLFAEDDVEGVRDLLLNLANDPVALAQFRKEHSEIARAYSQDIVAEAWAEIILDHATAGKGHRDATA